MIKSFRNISGNYLPNIVGNGKRCYLCRPVRKKALQKTFEWDQKNEKFIDRMDRAHNLDLRKIEMMKLGKKSEAFPECWRG